MTAVRTFRLLAFLAALSAAAGCGRRGDLDTPYEAAVEARKQAQEAGEAPPPEPEKPHSDRRFILDWLI